MELRSNKVLSILSDLEKVNRYKEVLANTPVNSTVEVERGLVKIKPSGTYIGHELVPAVKTGFNFTELATLMRWFIIDFEDKYKHVDLTQKEIDNLTQMVYLFNQNRGEKVTPKLKDTSVVLYYLFKSSISMINRGEGRCTLVFHNQGDYQSDFHTIYNESQIELLCKVQGREREEVGQLVDPPPREIGRGGTVKLHTPYPKLHKE